MKNTAIEKSNNLAEVEVLYKTKISNADKPVIKSSMDSFNILKDVFNPNRIEHTEEAIILLLNKSNKVLGWCKLSTGGISGTVIDPRVLFQIALGCNASNIIISHNHPSGSLVPSSDDIRITKRIKEGAELLDIRLLDHVIITTDGYYSFADEGMM